MSFHNLKEFGRLAKIGYLGIIRQYRRIESLLPALFKRVIAEKRIHTTSCDSSFGQERNYKKTSFIPIPDNPFTSELNSSVKRIFLSFINRISLGPIAIILLTIFVTACSPSAKYGNDLNIESTFLSNQSDQSQVEEAYEIWVQENGEEGDAFTAGKAAYDIAQLTRESRWSTEAIKFLEMARVQMPQFSLATAYLGSAHALAARDFPLRGLWQLFPGPGFVRIYHVYKAERLMNEAIQKDPKNPAVRLIYAASVIRMPGILVDHDKALDNFKLLTKWDENFDTNVSYTDVLSSIEWRQSFYSNYSEVLSELGETERANYYEEKLKSLSEDSDI